MIHLGDCVEVMRELPADSVDAIVTDPPYDLTSGKKGGSGVASVNLDSPYGRARIGTGNGSGGFMGKAWDGTGVAFDPVTWREAFRVAKPGAHLLAAGGTRTVHRLASAIEDAGWEIRDMLIWGYASGFPKSRQVSPDLLAAVPEDARCACEPRSTRTALGSQDGYRPERGSDGEPPHQDEGGDRAPAPSPAGARGRSRGGQRGDGPAEGPGHTLGLESIGHPSIEDWPGLTSPWSVGSQSGGSTQSGTPASTSPASPKEPRRRVGSRSSTPDSGVAAAASSWQPSGDTSWYSKCTSCEGWKVAPGLGTALKPSFEPWVMARKPLRGTVAANVLAHGTGALNIDATRIAVDPNDPVNGAVWTAASSPIDRMGMNNSIKPGDKLPATTGEKGRWPANLILTDPIFDGDTPGVVGGGDTHNQDPATRANTRHGSYFGAVAEMENPGGYGDSGTYSRFFELPKGGRSGILSVCPICGANGAESSSTERTPGDPTAQLSAVTSPPESSDQDVSSAASQSGLWSTDSAPSPAPTGESSGTDTTTDSPTTNGTGTPSSPEPSAPTSRTRPSPGSRRGRPSPTLDPASPAAPSSTSSATTTTTPSQQWCDSCVADAMRSSMAARESVERNYPWAFLIPKSSRSDREPVLRGTVERTKAGAMSGAETRPDRPTNHPMRENAHPTVKPLDLMRHLVRLVTPPGGTVLDCFLGSGTTAIACEMEGFAWIGIEKEPEYVAIAEARLNGTQRGLGLDVAAPTRERKTIGQHSPVTRQNKPREGAAFQWKGWAPEDEVPA